MIRWRLWSLLTEGPLRRGLALRLCLVLLIALMALSGTVVVVAERAEHVAAVRDVDEVVVALEQRIRSVQASWMSQADVLRAQLDFARLLDQPDVAQRSASLSAYFATLGGEGIFTHAVLVDASDGRTLWRYSTRSAEDLVPPATGAVHGWVFGERDGTLYRAIGQRALVAEQPAHLWLFVPLDHDLLAANAPPDVAVEVLWQGRVPIHLSAAKVDEHLWIDDSDHPTRALRWPGDPAGPELAIRRYKAPPINVRQALSLAALAGAVVAVLGWAVLVRWLARHAHKLGLLQSATRQFNSAQRVDDTTLEMLDTVSADSSTELQGLAADMRAMMQGLESSQRQQSEAKQALAELNTHLEERVEQRTHELALARDAALAGTRVKEQFLANMSHELRTPLSGMLGSLEVLDDRSLRPGQAELLAIARSSGQALLGIINEVLDFSKIESGHIALALAPFQPAQVIDEVARLFRADATRKGLALRTECEGLDASLVVLGDAARLRQVLLNLTANAVKFTARGAVTLRAERVDDGPAVARVQFSVTDTGPGIAEADQQRIFLPFEQVAGSDASTSLGGTGLGLAISDRLVAAMGGRLAISSEIAVGSRFQFELSLPVAQPEAGAPFEHQPWVAEATEPLPELGGTVLVVDDNVVNRIIVTQMLLSLGLGLRVLESEDGLHACDMVAAQPVDLILMDCMMPGLDGYGATRRIRAQQAARGEQRVAIVALTANAMPGDAAHCFDAGMDDYLSKPFTRRQLHAALRPWLPVHSP